MKILLTIFCCAAGTIAVAQPVTSKTYAETQRAQQHQREFDADMDAIRNNRNSTSGTAGGVDNKAAEELAELFRSRKNYKGPSQAELAEQERKERAARKAAREERQAQERAQNEYYSMARNAGITQHYEWAKPLYLQLKQIGFEEEDARQVSDCSTAYGTLSGATRYITSAFAREEMRQIADSVKQFYAELPTASYERLFVLSFTASRLVATYFKLADDLERRFPGKREELDKARLAATCSLYDRWGSGDAEFMQKNDFSSAQMNTDAVRKEYYPFFKAHYTDNMPLVLRMLASTRGSNTDNPLLWQRRSWKRKETVQEQKIYTWPVCTYLPATKANRQKIFPTQV